MACALGVATMWLDPNPITIAALSTWTYASWTMVAHHTCHGGYNRVDAGKYNSRGFALGSVTRRIADWVSFPFIMSAYCFVCHMYVRTKCLFFKMSLTIILACRRTVRLDATGGVECGT